MIRTRFLLLLLLCCACSATPPEAGDLGSFFPPDAGGVETTGGEVTVGEHLCLADPESGEEDLSVVGQVFEMSWENLWPGDHVGNVVLKVFDWCGTEVDQVTVQETGSYAFHLPVGEHGFDGWFEYPYKPDSVADADWPFGDYPLYREFDKPFRGAYIHCNLRIFAPEIVSLPLTMLKQKEEKGYIQGTLYDILTYDTLGGAVITPSSGTVTYISDAHLPDGTLTTTRSKGLFLVANTEPGPVALTVTLENGNAFTKTVLTWPLNSHPTKVITNVGVPVMPDML